MPAARSKKKRKGKKEKTTKRRRPTKAEKKAYQDALRNMIKPAARLKKKTGALSMTLLDVIKAFPAASQILKVYPNRASLCSLVCSIKKRSQEKTVHFFVGFLDE